MDSFFCQYYKDNPVEFIEDQLQFLDANTSLGGVPKMNNWNLYNYQKCYVAFLRDNKHTISTKFRQSGFTSLFLGYATWRALFRKGNVCFLSTSSRECTWQRNALLETLKKSKMPISFKCSISGVGSYIKIEDNFIYFCLASSENAPSLHTTCGFDCVLFDEAAFAVSSIEKQVIDLCHDVDECHIVSSCGKKQGFFYATYIDSLAGLSERKVFESDYKEHPSFRDDDRIKNLKKSCLSQFKQDWLQEFQEIV